MKSSNDPTMTILTTKLPPVHLHSHLHLAAMRRECFTGFLDALTIGGAPHFRYRGAERLTKKFTFTGYSFRIDNKKFT